MQQLDHLQRSLYDYFKENKSAELGDRFHQFILKTQTALMETIERSVKATRTEIRKAWMFAIEQQRKGQDMLGTSTTIVEEDDKLLKLAQAIIGDDDPELLDSILRA